MLFERMPKSYLFSWKLRFQNEYCFRMQTVYILKCSTVYTVLQKYAHIGLKQNLLRSTTLDIIANAAFVCVHVVGRFSKDFWEARWLRSRGFQLQVEWMKTVLCAEL